MGLLAWGRLSDDELIGVLRAARRLASWSAALELAAVTELATRREGRARRAGTGSCAPGEHIGDEIAAALTLSGKGSRHVLLDSTKRCAACPPRWRR